MKKIVLAATALAMVSIARALRLVSLLSLSALSLWPRISNSTRRLSTALGRSTAMTLVNPPSGLVLSYSTTLTKRASASTTAGKPSPTTNLARVSLLMLGLPRPRISRVGLSPIGRTILPMVLRIAMVR